MAHEAKVCFIVLAHHQPVVLGRLIDQISWPDADVVLHVDARSRMPIPALPGRAVHTIEKRRAVHWSGWSLTQALCDTLEAGLRISDAAHFMYLAGTDFPIATSDTVLTFLGGNRGTSFINHHAAVPGTWGFTLLNGYHFNDLRGRLSGLRTDEAHRISPARSILLRSVGNLERMLNQVAPRDAAWMRFFAGSSRWCLSRAAATFVVAQYHSGVTRRLERFLRFSANSDELFVQTVLLNSTHRHDCHGFDEKDADGIFARTIPPALDEKRVYFHYIDWSPQREDPAVLVDRDFDLIRESGKWFASKFTDERSLTLIDRIERELL